MGIKLDSNKYTITRESADVIGACKDGFKGSNIPWEAQYLTPHTI